ncbi:hypothetical protein KIF24_00855 [Micromonospora sp. Llam7]|uniref:hypothetical protein n=1 Tax=Micromonospora tarapacensis TaxID=2835305 RepID=UPI001C8300AC|nr:hypothetical protein [Micromonospora tarapacensis]MBX7264745.1 hypothetical protein [Micromonospora tarapacensis]
MTAAWPAPDRSTTAWPTADRNLERGYRTLLLAYPRRHRRRHGTEVVTTLLEMATPGQRRPRAGEAMHLIASGLRLRFRLPAGRPFMAIAALLTALTMGGFGAAAGSWLGAQTFADLPDDAAMTRLTQQAGVEDGPDNYSYTASPWAAETAFASGSVDGTWDAEQVRQRFAADGWSVSGLTPSSGGGSIFHDDGSISYVPLHGARFTAKANGLIVDIDGLAPADPGFVATSTGHVGVNVSPERTAAFLPLVVIGTTVGLLAGWLVAAAVGYRMVAVSPGPRRAAAGLWGMSLVLALPAVAFYGNVMRVFRYDHADGYPALTVHSAFTPGGYYPFGPSWLVLGLSAAGLMLAVATTLVARPGEQPPQQAVKPV